MIFSCILNFTILPLIIYFIYRKTTRSSKYMKNVPGPKPHFLFGNLIDFLFLPTYKYIDVFMGYIKTYGPIIKIHDGPLSVSMIVTDPELVEHILSSPKYLDKADQYNYLHGWLGEGLLVSTGTKWKKRRRTLTPSFHFSILDNFVDVFESVGDVCIEKLVNQVGKNSVDISDFISLCTLDIICEAAMGIKLNAQNNKTSAYVRSTKNMGTIIAERIVSVLHPSLYPFTYNYFIEKRALKILHAHTDGIINKKIAEKENALKHKDHKNTDTIGTNKKLAFLDLLLNCTIDGQYLSRIDLREEVDTFMFEGHDTTSSAISFALFSLATNPEVQEKAYLEQKQLFGKQKKIKITVTSLNEMKYLELVIKETLRLYPSVPLLGRRLPEDLNWKGDLFQKGTNVLLSTFAMHRDPQHFPDPLKFIPERFKDVTLTNHYVYTPFSAGPRNCIGQKFAILEMKSTISKILRHFELLPATPSHELQLAPEMILVSKNGICIALKKRII